MLWLIFAMLLLLGAVGLLAPYALGAGVIQILLISAVVAFGIQRIRAVSNSHAAVSNRLAVWSLKRRNEYNAY
jgi:hypothetical protein